MQMRSVTVAVFTVWLAVWSGGFASAGEESDERVNADDVELVAQMSAAESGPAVARISDTIPDPEFSTNEMPDFGSVESADSPTGLSLFDGTLFDENVKPTQSLLLQPSLSPGVTATTRIGRSNFGIASPIATFERGNTSNANQNAFGSLGRGIGRVAVAAYIQGIESKTRQSTDTGNLFFKSPAALGIRAVRRQPIVTDSKIRGSRSAQLNASGSYWVPARMDLDTAISKIDSRLLQDVVAIRGPYSSLYGPGFDFVDFQLQMPPRYEQFGAGGSTSIDYKSNGEQWYGRQTIEGGDSDSGFRFSYGHRTGNDYESGDGTGIPSSYKSRDIEFAYSVDLSSDTRLEFSALRLDQTDVEMPGQAFDIDVLTTDAYEVTLIHEAGMLSDQFELSSWYNRTELVGSAQRSGKRQQFPFYDDLGFVGNTDVDSMSTGYTAAWTWLADSSSVTAGTDLRYLRQELNEITSGSLGFTNWQDRNSPIPRSHHSNPGLFYERTMQLSEDVLLTSGSRLDLVSANVDEEDAELNDTGVRQPFEDPLSLAEILGTDDFDRDFILGSTFLLAEAKLTRNWTGTLGYGYAERAPTLTELYAAEPFMFLLQSGLNTVTGDPNLRKERLWQLDVGLAYDNGCSRAGINGFHAWVRDYITFEALRDVGGEQLQLKFVNTDLATLAGGEAYIEHDASPWLTTFATMSYVEGRDHSRNGDFATQRHTTSPIPDSSTASQQVAGQPRGEFSGVAGADDEPLASISPLEARLGLRIHEMSRDPQWSVELSARVVDNQDRVASSLLETATPGFTIWDVRGYWRPSQQLTLVAGIENFTDKQYREYLDFRPRGNGALAVYQPGINFYFGSEISY